MPTLDPAILDPVTFQVIMSRLAGIVDEMQESIFRTGYSTIIRESRDASCLLTDAEGGRGRRAAHPRACTSAASPSSSGAVRREFGDEIALGDAFHHQLNSYIGGTPHTLDMALIMPIRFFEGELVAFAGNTAHKSDLGGVVPGDRVRSGSGDLPRRDDLSAGSHHEGRRDRARHRALRARE